MDFKYLLLIGLVITGVTLSLVPSTPPAYANAQNNCRVYFEQNNNYTCTRAELCEAEFGAPCGCHQVGTCNLTDHSSFFPALLTPFDQAFDSVAGDGNGEGMTIVVMWGLMITIVWLRTQNPMLVAVLGIAMTASYLAALETVPTIEFEQAKMIGVALLLLSLGIAIYHLLHSRIYQPSS